VSKMVTKRVTKRQKGISLLSWSNLVLMSLLAGCTFAVSYASLLDLAIKSGVLPEVAPLWPLCLDGLMVLCALTRVQYSLKGKDHQLSKYSLFAAVVVSIALNMVHAPEGVVPKLIGAVPPLALFASSEIAIQQLIWQIRQR